MPFLCPAITSCCCLTVTDEAPDREAFPKGKQNTEKASASIAASPPVDQPATDARQCTHSCVSMFWSRCAQRSSGQPRPSQ